MILEELLKPDDVLRGNHSQYRILNLVGRGGMGAVYRAERTADSSIWALKEMRPPPDTPEDEIAENRKLFEQEAELMGMLSHPNLLVLADYFEWDGRPVMVMEFVSGQTLEEQIRDANSPLLEQQALIYGIQLCRVLNYLHNRKPPIIYRDLKPPNIMVMPQGVLKLIDFGVARTYKERKTKDTIAMGSAGYAPPEQYGKGQTDARSDIYALGATLLHLLVNLPPVPLQTPQSGYIRSINPSVDEKTERIIMKAMSLDREQRYASCVEMEQELLQCLDGPYIDPTEHISPPPALPQSAEPANHVAPAQDAPLPLPPVGGPIGPLSAAPSQQPAASGPVCASCGYGNKANARFCANCGSPVVEQPAGRLRIKSTRGSWEMKIDGGMPCRIGRRDPSQNHYPEVDLAEHDRGIASRHHATIQHDNGTYTLTDLGSTNGTFVNGARIAAFTPQALRPGDVIKIGEVEMEFRWS